MTSLSAEQIAANYWEALLPMRSFLGTMVGDERYNERVEDPTADGRAARAGLARSTLADLDRLGQGPTALAEGDIEDAVTGDVLRFLCQVSWRRSRATGGCCCRSITWIMARRWFS